MEAKIHFRSRVSDTTSVHGTRTDGEEFSGELQERSLAEECGPSEVKPSSSDACEVHGDGVADPELALNKTPGGISDDRATATWIRERAGVTVSTFQTLAILPSVRCRLSPQNLQLLEKGASDDALLGECISDNIDPDVCWWRIGNTENTAVSVADAQRAMQRMQISLCGNTRSHNAAPLTWSVAGGSREAASGIMTMTTSGRAADSEITGCTLWRWRWSDGDDDMWAAAEIVADDHDAAYMLAVVVVVIRHARRRPSAQRYGIIIFVS